VLAVVNYSVQDIFSWVFEVTDDASQETRGRLQFSLEYELTNNRMDVYAPIQNKATALIPIRSQFNAVILPIVKVRSISLHFQHVFVYEYVCIGLHWKHSNNELLY